MTPEEAEDFTQGLGQVGGGWWKLVLHAQRQGVPAALGMTTQQWVTSRLGGYMKYDAPERREIARQLTAKPEEDGEGLSQREAAAVLGVGPMTVNRDIHPQVPNATGGPNSVCDELGEPGDTVPNDTGLPESVTAQAGLATATGTAHVSRNSGDNEWYTPAKYIGAAVAVMGGIDLDPASAAAANEIVGATQIWTKDDDGLVKPWRGRLWMNPPYAQPLVGSFCTRIAREYDTTRAGAVTQACVLVNNATETTWFQEMTAQASAMCLPRGRVEFWHPQKKSAPLQGQAIVYLGPESELFCAEFVKFGVVWRSGSKTNKEPVA